MAYGPELILDLYGCDVSKFNRRSIKEWLKQLCELIDMTRADLHWWDYKGVPQEDIPYDQPHLVGTSAVQFITTSDIVIHTLDMVGECYINIFTCKDLNVAKALEFTKEWFGAKDEDHQLVVRGHRSKCNNIFESDCMDCVSHGKCSGGQKLCGRFKGEVKK